MIFLKLLKKREREVISVINNFTAFMSIKFDDYDNCVYVQYSHEQVPKRRVLEYDASGQPYFEEHGEKYYISQFVTCDL